MKRGRLPLTALRSFEAAGRRLSFSRAADELFVSQAAISRQIRELEALIDQPLFRRQHRQVVLTEAGERLLAQLTPSFDAIDARLHEIMNKTEQLAVSISVEPSFAGAWLVPRLNQFNTARPDIDIIIDASPALTDFRGNSVDLAIRHSLGATSWQRTQSRHIADCFKMPVAAPSLLEREPPELPADLRRYTLLHEENRNDWSDWFRFVGADEVELRRGPIFPDAALAVQSAILGHGIALGCWLLNGKELGNGSLVAPFPFEMPYGAYWLVAPDFSTLSEPAKAFAGWLHSQLEEQAKAAQPA